MKRFFLLILSLLFLFSLCGCNNVTLTKTDKLQVVTTTFPPYDFVRQIAGDKVELTMLLAPGQESHTFEPTPKDLIRLTNADLFILGGGVSDQWALRLIESAELDESKALKMMDCTEAVPEELTEGMQHTHSHEKEVAHFNEEKESQDHSKHYAYDEHVWTSPLNAAAICEKIAERLMEADSKNAPLYQENLANYLKELASLDETFTLITKNGARHTLVFADRFPFRYFADRYGLTYFAAFPGCSGETEPDAATMAFLVDKVRKEQLPAVFYTELSNRKIADAVCEATDAKPLLMHSCHTVTKDEFERGETYVSLMKQNAAALKEALS